MAGNLYNTTQVATGVAGVLYERQLDYSTCNAEPKMESTDGHF